MFTDSDSPDYPVHPVLLSLIERWDQELPGVAEEVINDIRGGDWETDDDDAPPYTVAGAFGAAFAHFVAAAVLSQYESDRKNGPWYVRWGFKSPGEGLNEQWKARVEQVRRDLDEAFSGIPASVSDRRYSGR